MVTKARGKRMRTVRIDGRDMPAPREHGVSVKKRATVSPIRPCTWLAVATARQRATGRTWSARLRATAEGFLTAPFPATVAASVLCKMVTVTAATKATATATIVIRTVRAMTDVVREAEEPLRLDVDQGRRCGGSSRGWQDKEACRRLDEAPVGRSRSTALPSPLCGTAPTPPRMTPTRADGQANTNARLPSSCLEKHTPVSSLFCGFSAQPRLSYCCLPGPWAYCQAGQSLREPARSLSPFRPPPSHV